MASRGCASMGRTPPSLARACRSASRCRSSSARSGSRSASPSTSRSVHRPHPVRPCHRAPLRVAGQLARSHRGHARAVAAPMALALDRRGRHAAGRRRRHGVDFDVGVVAGQKSAAPASTSRCRSGPPRRGHRLPANPAPAPGPHLARPPSICASASTSWRAWDIAGAVTGTALISLRAANYYTPQRIALAQPSTSTPALTLHAEVAWLNWAPSREASPICASPSRWRDALDGAGRLPRRRPFTTSSCRAPASSIAVRCSATSASRVAWAWATSARPCPTRRADQLRRQRSRLVAAGVGLELSGLLRCPRAAVRLDVAASGTS